MADERIITAEGITDVVNEAMLTADGKSAPQTAGIQTGTLQDRIAAATKAGGLKQLPEDFDSQQGDWRCIKSTDPFTILYLDYKLTVLITPQMVSSNFALLEKFWKDKTGILNTGGNRIGFKNKYGDGLVEGSLSVLRKAYDKISTKEGIERYYEEVNNTRLRNGAEKLKDSIQQMVMDGVASKEEINFCLEQGSRHDLSENEIAAIIKRKFDELGITPEGSISGETLVKQLVSVQHWMTKLKHEEAERIRKDREALKVQILKGKFATTIEEIGTILFDDPAEAKEIIKEDLLKGVVAQKDVVLARDIAAITKSEKDINLAFCKIVYKLNPSLPYTFMGRDFTSITELCVQIFANKQTIKQGREDLQKGYIEAWLKETNTKAHSLFLIIRDAAENLDLALLSFIYTFAPHLPYRLADSYVISNPAQFSEVINNNMQYWQAAKTEIFNSAISTWLRIAQKSDVPNHWDQVKERFIAHQDIGVECFLRILDNKLEQPHLEVNNSKVNYPAIQSGQVIKTTVVVTNTTRGYIEGYSVLTKEVPGVSLSSSGFSINNASGQNQFAIQLTIDSTNLLKGVAYQTTIQIKTTEQQELFIPVSFNIVFPKNSFLKQTALYAGIGALFFALIRLILASQYFHHPETLIW